MTSDVIPINPAVKQPTDRARINCVVDAQAGLGEGTFWDTAAQCLWWVDILGQLIHRYDPVSGESRSFYTPQRPGCVATRARGGLVLAMGAGFFHFDPATGAFHPLAEPQPLVRDTRFNDGKTDRQGRFWSGSMFGTDGKTPENIGALWRLDSDLSCHRLVEGIGCSNGLAWSPDSRHLYFTDSHGPLVWQWDFDPATGEVENRRVFIDFSPARDIGDGATVDAEGCYWLTVPTKGTIQRYDASGKLIRTILMPTDTPTCCEFGGKNLDVLYVTTATFGRSRQELAGQSYAGGLFAVETGVKGLPLPPFAG